MNGKAYTIEAEVLHRNVGSKGALNANSNKDKRRMGQLMCFDQNPMQHAIQRQVTELQPDVRHLLVGQGKEPIE